MSAAPYIHLDFRKWPDTPHWHCHLFELGADEHGRWFFLPRGSNTQRGAGPLRSYPGATLKLLPPDGRYLAGFSSRDQQLDVYVDVCANPRSTPGRLRLVDVDLDVVRHWDGHCQIIDRDELEENRRRFGYPAKLVESAEATAGEVLELLRHRREPFNRVGASRLQEAMAQDWPVNELPALPTYDDRARQRVLGSSLCNNLLFCGDTGDDAGVEDDDAG